MTLCLRPYQIECNDSTWEEIISHPTALVNLPTGSGKTFTLADLMRRAIEAKPNIKIIMVMSRIDLVTQTERALSRVIPRKDIGVYCGFLSRKETERTVTVASINSLKSLNVSGIDLLIIDEVHELDQEKGSYLKFVTRCQDLNHKIKIIGYTATAFRADGLIYGEDKLFHRVCFKRTIQEMIELGFLCKPILKHTDHGFDTSRLRTRMGEYRAEDIDALVADDAKCSEQVIDALSKMKDRNCIAWATANINHCTKIVEELTRLGERATGIHSKQDRTTRDDNLSAFMGGSMRHMVFVSILSTGFDHPPIDSIVLMRPTRSPVLYVQTVGRGLRPYGDKQNCLVLDYGNVVAELGPLDNPKVKGMKQDGKPVLKACPQCHSYCFGGCAQCPDCGYMFPIKELPEDKLSSKSESEAIILSAPTVKEPPIEFIANDVYMSMHESKAGNLCVKITYGENKNIIGRSWPQAEFFSIKSPWAMERFNSRCADLGILPKTPEQNGEIRVNGNFNVAKVRDGQYYRVTSVRRIEPDTSFNFGANEIEEPKQNSPKDIGFN